MSGGRRPRAALRRQPAATPAMSRNRHARAIPLFTSSSARQRVEIRGRICRCCLGPIRDYSSRPFRSLSQLVRMPLRSWWLSGPNNRRKNIAQRISSSGWILKLASIISTRARHMAMRERAATPAAAKRKWRACVQWQTDPLGGRPEISRNRMVSFRLKGYLWRRDVRRLAVFSGCYSADQRRRSLLFRQNSSR